MSESCWGWHFFIKFLFILALAFLKHKTVVGGGAIECYMLYVKSKYYISLQSIETLASMNACSETSEHNSSLFLS